MFHYFDQKYFVVDVHRRILRRDHAMNTLIVRRSPHDSNRFTGQSHQPLIAGCEGLYCALQPQALVNEVAHYVESERAQKAAALGVATPKPLPRTAVMYAKAAVKIRTMDFVLAADFSPHNPSGMQFVNSLSADSKVRAEMATAGKGATSLWNAMNDGEDYSVARGLGLAMAKYRYAALCVQTARTSERSDLERGDNLVFFGKENNTISGLSIVEAYLFPIAGPLEIYPVEF